METLQCMDALLLIYCRKKAHLLKPLRVYIHLPHKKENNIFLDQ